MSANSGHSAAALREVLKRPVASQFGLFTAGNSCVIKLDALHLIRGTPLPQVSGGASWGRKGGLSMLRLLDVKM